MNAYKPRNYQEECLEKLAEVREQGTNKALVVMASGLGKTLTATFDIREFLQTHEGERVLVLCHSAAILSQTKEIFKVIFGDNYSYGMYNGAEKAEEWTDFLFANLQSVNLHSEKFVSDEFCYVIVDEAHHAPARTYRKAIEHFRPEFLLGMTATPDRMDDADLSEVFGETVFEYDLVSAVNDGWLSEIDYRLELDELENLETFLNSKKSVSAAQLNREVFIPKRDEEIIRLIRERSAEKDNPTTTIFCQTIEHAEHFAELMGDAAVIHSQLPDYAIKERLDGFRTGKIKTVCSVNMLNEGIDIPRTDVIVFLRVTQSRIVFYQQLGRGLRLAEGKDKVLVLDFVATAERLEQIFDLEHEFKGCVNTPKGTPAKQREKFTLDIDTPKFKERKVDIVELIEEAKNYTHFIPDEVLIQDFCKECEELGHFPGQDDFKYHPGAEYRKRFGSLRNVAMLAGCMDYWNNYTHRSRGFPEDEALDLLASLFHRLGRVPSYNEINTSGVGMPTQQYYQLHFGGIREALARRGIYPSNEQLPNGVRIWDKENIPGALKKFYEELDRPIRQKDIRLGKREGKNIPGMVSIRNIFGNLQTALLYADLPVEQPMPMNNKKALAIYQELGLPIDDEELCRFVVANYSNPNSPARLFNLATIKKRLDVIEKRDGRKPKKKVSVRPSRSELINSIRLKTQQLGKAPTKRDMDNDPTMPSSYFLRTEFGSFNKALKAARVFVAPACQKGVSDDELLRILKAKAEKLGRVPTLKDITQDSDMPNASTYYKHFGNLGNAFKRAGLISKMDE